MNKRYSRYILLLIISVLGIYLDQFTKSLAIVRLKNQGAYVLIDGVLEFLYAENTGVSFGLLKGMHHFVFAVAFIVIIGILILLYYIPDDKRYIYFTLCVCFIFAGAIGNIIDRIKYSYVVDFIYLKLINFPIFNLADVYISVASFSFIILYIFMYKNDDFFNK